MRGFVALNITRFTMWQSFKGILKEAFSSNLQVMSTIVAFNGIGFLGRLEYLVYSSLLKYVLKLFNTHLGIS